MKRSCLGMQEVVARGNLEHAFFRASRSAGRSPEVERFSAHLDEELGRMRCELLAGTFRFGDFNTFEIRDPKLRRIHAPAFRERVAHHALMAIVGPVLDRGLIEDTFACRLGKGTLAAVQRAQSHLRKYAWYVKIDIASYFDSIDHDVLKTRPALQIPSSHHRVRASDRRAPHPAGQRAAHRRPHLAALRQLLSHAR